MAAVAALSGRRLAAAVAAIAALVLSACATVAPLGPADGGETLSGRLALRVEPIDKEPARSFTAAFDLRGDARHGALGLSTPLGSLLAQAKWSPGAVALTTPQGSRAYPDLESLTHDVLGESVPVEAWFDWLHGRPSTASPSTPTPGANGFEQLGWQVDLARLDAGAVVATRHTPLPMVTVRIQLERG